MQDGTAMDLQHRDAGKLPLAAGCQVSDAQGG